MTREKRRLPGRHWSPREADRRDEDAEGAAGKEAPHDRMYMDVITGMWAPHDVLFTVNGDTRTFLYYLVDGIHPRFTFFVIDDPTDLRG